MTDRDVPRCSNCDGELQPNSTEKMCAYCLVDVYKNILVKLVRCIANVDKTALKTVTIGYMDREDTPASSHPPSYFAKYLQLDAQEDLHKYLLTSIEVKMELLDRAKGRSE